ncbi:hypothetical protein WMF18_36045 [Sorangium sp. So ce315]|uniref:hypothetical protein n=1 Tax=Sorangium sp. So ce315 TaxID=3133299 RepID=UPI003F5D9F4B
MMARRLGIGSALLSLVALAAGCGGLSTEEAQERCDRLRDTVPFCSTDESHAACVSCHEECGDDCEASPTCPQTFACVE